MQLSTDMIFQDIIQRLLEGGIICENSSDTQYRYLREEDQYREVDQYLRKIGRLLKATDDGIAYYCAYLDIENSDAKTQVKRLLGEAINDLEPLVRWLKLTAAATQSGSPIKASDRIKSSDLLSSIESAPALSEELDRISRGGLFNSKSTDPKRQVDFVLNKLVDQGYLVKDGPSGLVFKATGKWSRLYEILQYIASHESIGSEDNEQQQLGLIH